MWLKLLFAVVNVIVNIDSPSPNTSDQLPEIPSTHQDNPPDTPFPEPNNPTEEIIPSQEEEGKQQEQEENGDLTNLHIMVASHTDAGWIETFEGYYRGAGGMAGGCVRCILDNLMRDLPRNKARKYDMSEISFFKRWWSDQSEERKNAFKILLQNNQFEFINGAWAANDEATAYYDDIMDNFIIGHRWLQDNLDVDPLIGWQVDSFGNSATHAALMAQAGYEGMFFSRADYVDREIRREEQALQYNWAPPNPHNETVFTQMLYVAYSDTKFMVADNFNCRSVFCKGNLKPDEYHKVVDYVRKQRKAFKTNNILFLVCDDFHLWQDAEKDYAGAEAMIKYFKEHPETGIRAQFSHLSDYLNQVKKDFAKLGSNVTIPVKHDDTFPYVEKPGHVWTGYFTSKPMFKLLVRESSEYYNAVKLLLAKVMLLNKTNNWDETRQNSVNEALIKFEEPLAIVQHHDGVSGTMKEFVKADYQRMLSEGRSALESTIEPIIVDYLKEKIGEELTPFVFNYDWLYQDTRYEGIFKTESTAAFTVFNPGQARKLLIKIKVPQVGYSIVNEANQDVETDNICHSEDTNSECFMYFVEAFPAYATKVYKIKSSANAQKLTPEEINNGDMGISAADKLTLRVKSDLQNFDYSFCEDIETCVGDSFNLGYQYYESVKIGDQAPSGAYVFNPTTNKQEYSATKSGRIYNGKYVKLVQIFRDKLRTDMSIFNHQPERGIAITTYLDPLSPSPSGKEVVLLVKSNSIKNGNTVFYTDTNGYYMQKRQKNHKDNFNLDISNDINVNYYPLTSNMYIEGEDSGLRLSVVTDRAQGGTSLSPGEVEIMIHRVTVKDDWKGVSEPLQERNGNDLIRVTTRHFLTYSNSKLNITDQRRQQQYDLDRPPRLWFYTSSSSEFSGTVDNSEQTEPAVPDMVKLYVRSYELNEYVVRLNNLDENNSKEVKIFDLESKASNLLQQLAGKEGIKVTSVVELSWTTTREKSQVPMNEMDPSEPEITHDDDGKDYSSISLLPMEIRTFSIQVEI